MKTRYQLNGKIVATQDATNRAANRSGTAVVTTNESPSPPRLRDRRPAGIECRPQASSTLPNGLPPISPGSSKRSPMGPTRILPRRSSGRVNSLLGGSHQHNSMKSSPNKITTVASNQIDSRKHTHQTQKRQSAASDSESDDVSLIACPDTITTNKTANIRNYSRHIPPINSALTNKEAKHDNNQVDHIKTKPVRITLPESTSILSPFRPGESNKPDDPHDKCTYVITSNGLKKVGLDAEASTETEVDSITIDDDSERERVSNSVVLDAGEKVFNILLGVTGSVATIKLVELIKKIKSMFPRPYQSKTNGASTQASINIKIVMTENSKHFAHMDELIKDLGDPDIVILDDSNEWASWKEINDPVLHIDLRKWADLCLIAPLDANTMAKMATGICDNLLTCVARAWDFSKPLILCPAMNVHMFNHPITKEHLTKLQSFGFIRIDCVEKRLACGDYGMGGMASVETISKKVVECLFHPPMNKLSIARPILNQQPTYPIIATSDTREGLKQSNRMISSSVKDQILNNFRANNQITIHAVESRNLRSDQPSASRRPNSLISRTEKTISIIDRRELLSEKDKSQNLHNSIGNKNSTQNVVGGVTSVLNLKAISMGDDVVFCNGESGLNPSEDDMAFDLDPSNLLEQSMITDDFVPEDQGPRNALAINPSQSFDNGASYDGESAQRIGSLSPLFNASKFLALCYNKERDCFTCRICKHDYKNRKSMARHLKEQHVQGSIFHCKPCGVSYKRREKLIKHNRERHPDEL